MILNIITEISKLIGVVILAAFGAVAAVTVACVSVVMSALPYALAGGALLYLAKYLGAF